MNKFCVMTTGRAGSTALMDVLAGGEDVMVPCKQLDCVDNELLHPRHIQRYMAHYQRASQLAIQDEMSLIDAFYQSAGAFAYAGFKSMPARHRDLARFVSRADVQFITLTRQDLASTVASFIIAIDQGTWRRDGGEQQHRLVFGPQYAERALSHLRYVQDSQAQLRALPNSIALEYEDLVQPSFRCDALDDYFGRPIKLKSAKEATKASAYVENWSEFESFIRRHS